MRRLTGLLLIVRTLAPVLAVLILYWGYTRIIDDFQIAMRPIQSIENEMSALGATIDSAREQFDAAREQVENAVQVVQGFRVPDILPNLSANLSIPSIEIPSISVPVLPTVSVRFSSATGSVSRTIEGACRT
ncbi:MAG: hypothetical protein K8J31_29660, partial [Anaerolineae bacterium]|nr:hypothetical protein [Anaerolineae bacterium]